jgi:ketosteroid isomerase-like protein
MSETFSSSSHEVLELQAAGPHVIASVIFRAEGTGSGVSVEQPEFHVWTFQDDKVSRFAWFRNREEQSRPWGRWRSASALRERHCAPGAR